MTHSLLSLAAKVRYLPYLTVTLINFNYSTWVVKPLTHRFDDLAQMATSSSPSQTSLPPPDPQRTAEARAAFTAHLTSIGNSHVSALESRVSDIHSNSVTILKQEDELAKQTKKLGDESKKHQKIADEAGKKLKELGDIQNWAEVLERDLLVLETTMKMGEGEESGWETEEEDEVGAKLDKPEDRWKGKGKELRNVVDHRQ